MSNSACLMRNFVEDINVYDIISILAECFQSKATVHLAKHIPSGQIIAMKRVRLEKILGDISLVEKEIVLARQLKHPNILTYYSTFVHGPEVLIISPLQDFGSCKSLLKSYFNEGLPELAIILILKDVLEALNYLHKSGYIHRALRASHILISSSGTACLTGLRYACPIIKNGKWQRAIHSFPLTTQPNLCWLSPELLQQDLKGYNEKSDIYSVGMVCCELANGIEPFSDVVSTLMLVEKLRGWVPRLLDCNTTSFDNDNGNYDISANIAKRKFSQYLHGLCYMCLDRDPSNRPTASQLLTHPLFKISRGGITLTELLKPALPLDDNMAFNKDEMVNVAQNEYPSEMGMDSFDWDFCNDIIS